MPILPLNKAIKGCTSSALKRCVVFREKEEVRILHIGLLEDDDVLQELWFTALILKGYSVSSYTRGSRFVASLPIFHYDVVILDVNFPEDLSGFQVIKEVQRITPTTSLPFLLITGADDEGEPVHLSMPNVTLLRKPFPLSFLLHFVDMIREGRL